MNISPIETRKIGSFMFPQNPYSEIHSFWITFGESEVTLILCSIWWFTCTFKLQNQIKSQKPPQLFFKIVHCNALTIFSLNLTMFNSCLESVFCGKSGLVVSIANYMRQVISQLSVQYPQMIPGKHFTLWDNQLVDFFVPWTLFVQCGSLKLDLNSWG